MFVCLHKHICNIINKSTLVLSCHKKFAKLFDSSDLTQEKSFFSAGTLQFNVNY